MRGNRIKVRLVQDVCAQSKQTLFQYDYGQTLILEGVKLPLAYEVHFSNKLYGQSKTQIGNADGVAIPDEYLVTGERVYFWIYLHEGESDGETEYNGFMVFAVGWTSPSRSPLLGRALIGFQRFQKGTWNSFAIRAAAMLKLPSPSRSSALE